MNDVNILSQILSNHLSFHDQELCSLVINYEENSFSFTIKVFDEEANYISYLFSLRDVHELELSFPLWRMGDCEINSFDLTLKDEIYSFELILLGIPVGPQYLVKVSSIDVVVRLE